MNDDIDIKQELLRAIVGVARHKEFYGHVVQQFEKKFVRNPHDIDTAAVGRQPGQKFVKLWMNEDYFESIYKDETSEATTPSEHRDALRVARDKASGAVEHEILHVVFNHIARVFEDGHRGNIACDCVVNQCLMESRRRKEWIMPEMFDLPSNQTAQWYYENLLNNEKYQQMCSDGAFGPRGVMSWLKSSHGIWGDIQNDPMVQEFLKDIVRKAVENTSAQGWGEIPGNVKCSIEDLLKKKKPKIPWSRVFRGFCASATESVLDYTMMRESRRFGTRPGIRKKDKLNIAVIIDTSGSISNEQLATFFNEVRWIWQNGAEVTVFEADHNVQRSYQFRGKFDGFVHGRGGTSLEPGLIAAEDGRFDAAVYFTDFWAAKISRRYRLPVLWVLSNQPENETQWPCDWGRMVKIDDAA